MFFVSAERGRNGADTVRVVSKDGAAVVPVFTSERRLTAWQSGSGGRAALSLDQLAELVRASGATGVWLDPGSDGEAVVGLSELSRLDAQSTQTTRLDVQAGTSLRLKEAPEPNPYVAAAVRQLADSVRAIRAAYRFRMAAGKERYVVTFSIAFEEGTPEHARREVLMRLGEAVQRGTNTEFQVQDVSGALAAELDRGGYTMWRRSP